MITRDNYMYVLACDICMEPEEHAFKEYVDLEDFKKFMGWQRKPVDGEWRDVCPEHDI